MLLRLLVCIRLFRRAEKNEKSPFIRIIKDIHTLFKRYLRFYPKILEINKKEAVNIRNNPNVHRFCEKRKHLGLYVPESGRWTGQQSMSPKAPRTLIFIRVPKVLFEIDVAVWAKADALCLQPGALFREIGCQPAAVVDAAVAGQTLRRKKERLPRHARGVAKPGQMRQLAIGRDAPGRDMCHNFVNLFKVRFPLHCRFPDIP